ncbi:MAG: 3-hydroxyacyl-CoA dehydrogenase family protein [Candidatus Thorarchaeota archaeon]
MGSGLIGQGWGALFALKGCDVILMDVDQETTQNALERTRNHIDYMVKTGLGKNPAEAKNRLSTSTSISDSVTGADFVIESVYENLEDKQSVFAEMDMYSEPDVVLASSTSGLLMTEIQKTAGLHPERCVVAHPWNPSHLIPLVEISPGEKTSTETVDACYEVMERVGKVPVKLNFEAQGFIANRLSVALWREALSLVDRGICSAEDVDKAMTAGPGLRWAIMGPFMTYHLGGGEGGIEYLMRHIGVQKEKWLESMAKWTRIPESAVQKAIEGVSAMDYVRDKSLEELESWRDERLVALLQLLWS